MQQKATHGTEQSGSDMTERQIADIHLHRTVEEKCSHTHTHHRLDITTREPVSVHGVRHRAKIRDVVIITLGF